MGCIGRGIAGQKDACVCVCVCVCVCGLDFKHIFNNFGVISL
jgi:hypothetical protein